MNSQLYTPSLSPLVNFYLYEIIAVQIMYMTCLSPLNLYLYEFTAVNPLILTSYLYEFTAVHPLSLTSFFKQSQLWIVLGLLGIGLALLALA